MSLLPTLATLLITGITDCNGNGIDDAIDLIDQVSTDCDINGVPDECQPCEDCDGNGVLDDCADAAGGGLAASYWIDEDGPGDFDVRVWTQIDPFIDFNWGGNAPDVPNVPSDNFCVRWSGMLTPVVTGTITFRTTTDDGVRLWVDDQQIINRWIEQSPTTWTGSIDLTAGVPVAIRMEYFEAGGGAEARLEWEGPGLAREVIPTSALWPQLDVDFDGSPDDCPDCNGNGIPDRFDIVDGFSLDCDGNCVPDECDIVKAAPVGYWRFEQAGGALLDEGPNGLIGAATLATSSPDVAESVIPQTSVANTLSLDLGGAGYGTVTDPGGFTTMAGDSFTAEAWVRLDTLSNTGGANQRQYLLQKKVIGEGGAFRDYALMVQGGEIQGGTVNFGKTEGFTGRELVAVFGTGTSVWTVTSFLQINDNDWHHVSFAFDAASEEMRFGVDGNFETLPFDNLGHYANDGPLLIGAHTNASGNYNQFLRGSVDEVRLMRGVLPPLRLLRSSITADCNGNGIPDTCDIDAGTSDDCNGDGVPDECDPDCNRNGIPDGCDLINGTSLDCQQDGIPDECQLGSNDCDSNGIPDDCDVAELDCNLNGVPDPCDVLDGTSDDCQGDGIPDECQLTVDAIASLGDGNPDYAVIADAPYTTWINAFQAGPNPLILDAIDMYFVNIPIGREYDLYVWLDPDDDGNPDDATLLTAVNGSIPGTNAYFPRNVPDTTIPAFATYFVGFSVRSDQPGDFPAPMDIGNVTPRRSWIIGTTSPFNPNNPPANSVLFSYIDDSIFEANWSMNVRLLDPVGDCNLNGVPDSCDILDGIVEDVDLDGIPDECQDCNANGILDSIDLSAGTSADCNADGVPDECQWGTPEFSTEYLYDDGTSETTLAVGAPAQIAWYNRFVVEPGGEWIGAIGVVYGPGYPNYPIDVVVWSDPNNDGDPSDAQVLTRKATVMRNIGTNIYNVVEIPGTYIGEAGTSYFVGAFMDDNDGFARPMAIDVSSGQSEDSWYSASTFVPLDLNNLSIADFYDRWTFGHFMIRAYGFDGAYPLDCNDNEVPDECDIDDGTLIDSNGNGVPDDCECVGDVNGSGFVDFEDILEVLANWNTPYTFDDLLAVLANWGTCP